MGSVNGGGPAKVFSVAGDVSDRDEEDSGSYIMQSERRVRPSCEKRKNDYRRCEDE
jgi:hypothetical protein